LSIQNTQISELLVNAIDQELYVALIRQLNKDFMLANLEYEIDVDCTPELLKQKLTVIVAELVNNEFDSFLNLLYRIDLSEDNVVGLPKENQETYIASISFLILKREWKKVWFRRKYSS
jgi:hypothetical protein